MKKLLKILFGSTSPTPVPTTPVIAKLEPSFALQQFPNHTNFAAEVKDTVVHDTMEMFFDAWADLSNLGKNKVQLSEYWTVEELDDCMDFVKVGFFFNGKEVFTIGRYRGKIKSAYDLRELFVKELRSLIIHKLNK